MLPMMVRSGKTQYKFVESAGRDTSRDSPRFSFDRKRLLAYYGSSRAKTGVWLGYLGDQMSLEKVPAQGLEGRVLLTC